MKRIKERLADLECRFSTNAVALYFGDGSTKTLFGPKYFLCDLFVAACSGTQRSGVQAAQLELIRDAICAEEPGGGHMTELIRVTLAAGEGEPVGQSELDAIG